MECRENPAVDPEISVAHVGAFEYTLESQCQAPEIIWSHLGL
jgi:hypothetical protein